MVTKEKQIIPAVRDIMAYKRKYVRVPIRGEAFLSFRQETPIRAKAFDISLGGLSIKTPLGNLAKHSYDVVIIFEDDRQIELTAELVREDEKSLGFKTVQLKGNSTQILQNLIFEYQKTTDFIRQIEEHNLFDLNFIDDDGQELDITFNVELEFP